MSGVTTRDLVFSIWAASGQDQTRTVAALLTVAAGQFNVIKRGGAVLVSSSIGGQSFSFQLPAGSDGLVVSIVRQAWREVKDLSSDDFTTYLTGTTSNVIQPIFCNANQ